MISCGGGGGGGDDSGGTGPSNVQPIIQESAGATGETLVADVEDIGTFGDFF